MKKSFARLFLVLSGLLVLLPFTNCSDFSNSSSSLAGATSCTTANCITPNVSNMSLSRNVNGASASVTVVAGVNVYSVSGECNEAGFTKNAISWTLTNANGQVMRTSSQAYASDGVTPSVNYQCVNGRFLVSFTVAPISGDNRTLNASLMARQGTLTVNLSPMASVTDGSLGASTSATFAFAN